MIISASIISANFAKLEKDLQEAISGGIDWLHIDVMDGAFVPNITIGPMILPVCRRITNIPLDVHLMIKNPENHIHSFAKEGANRITVHVENNPNIMRTIHEIRELGIAPGVVLNPGTPVESVEYLLPFVDHVLIMTVNPGFSGQKFIPEMVEKIKIIKDKITSKKLNVLIQVDGGINSETIVSVAEAGADVIVSATAIFGFPAGIKAGINALRTAY